MRSSRHALYVSHTGMSEPLGRSQVVPYLRGLARAGWRFDVVAFEPHGARPEELTAVTELLAADGIRYRWARRSAAHDLGTKLRESTRALMTLLAAALRARPRVIHARSYLPAAVARAATALVPGARFVFDCRGLLGEEYVDAGHWRRDSLRYRLLKQAERRLFGDADAVVVLTDRARQWLRNEARLVAERAIVDVIPCCVDLERFRFDPAARTELRARLGAGDRLVVAYSGTLGSWYRETEMAALFDVIRRKRAALFTVFTRSDATRLRQELARRGVPDADVVVQAAAPAEMPRWLSAADVAVSLIEPCFSKIASSPVKVPEYLATGLPVVANRDIGDQDALMRSHPESLLDAGAMDAGAIAAVGERVAALPPADAAARERHRAVAAASFSLERVGIARYRALYERLAG